MLGNDRGGGRHCFSTAGDLLIWNDALTNGRLGAFVTEKLQEPATLNNGRKLGYARGLILDTYRGGKLVWHTGSAAGYRSFAGPLSGARPFHRHHVQCRRRRRTARRSRSRIFDLFVPAADGRRRSPRSRAGRGRRRRRRDGVDLNSKAGLFFNERTGEPLRLIVDNGRLRIAGGRPLVPVTNDRFRKPRGASLQFMSQDEFELNFLSQDQFELKSMEGKTTRYRRAQPYAPTADDLQGLCRPIRKRRDRDNLPDRAPGKDGLVIRLERFAGRRVSNSSRSIATPFSSARMTMRFLRDKAGKVVGFDYSNPVLRNIKFTRLSDRQ